MLNSRERGTIDAIRRRLKERQDAISADRDLSPQGKRAARAREQLAAEQAHQQVMQAASARHEAAVNAAYGKTFGAAALAGTDVTAARDAAFFADTVDDPKQALRHFAAADRRGDVSLCVALAAKAWDRTGTTDINGGWARILDAFAASSPARNASLGTFAELARPSKAERFRQSTYQKVERPPDLQTGSLEAIAGEPQPQTTTTGA